MVAGPQRQVEDRGRLGVGSGSIKGDVLGGSGPVRDEYLAVRAQLTPGGPQRGQQIGAVEKIGDLGEHDKVELHVGNVVRGRPEEPLDRSVRARATSRAISLASIPMTLSARSRNCAESCPVAQPISRTFE